MNRDVSDDPEVQLALEIANLCQTLNVLPRAGGLLDQDAYHVYLIKCVIHVQQKQQELEMQRAKSGRG